MNTILFEIENGVGYVTLNRPDSYNSVNRLLAKELLEVLKSCEANTAVRCLYVTGAGKAFCSGQDLTEAQSPSAEDFDRIISEQYNPIIKMLRYIPKPVVAAVNGVAAGAGANIALACDIIVANTSAYFIQAFSKIGLIPDSGGTYFLPRLVGLHRAAALMMTGDKLSAEEAMGIGIVYKCYSPDSFMEESRKFALQLAQMPTRGLALTKQLLNVTYQNSLVQQLEAEKQQQMEAGSTQDFKEGTTAFLEKRKPNFIGK